MNEVVSLKSGHELKLQICDFETGFALFQALAAELKQVDIELETFDLKTIAGKDLNSVKNVICQILSSKAIMPLVWKCFARCTIDGVAIKKDSFEPEDMRGDFLPSAWEVIKINLRPFLSGLDLSSFTSKEQPTSDQP